MNENYEILSDERFKIGYKHGIWIMGHHVCTEFKPFKDSYLIRIASANNDETYTKIFGSNDFKPLVYKEIYAEILELLFDDVGSGDPGMTVFGKEHAKKVIDFFEKIPKGENLVVHCWAGISRSSAVGCAWAYYNKDTEAEMAIRSSSFAVPNSLVYSEICKEINARMYPELGRELSAFVAETPKEE